MKRSVVVVSVDGLSSADLQHLQSLANFRDLMRRGSFCPEMRGVYPTQTYPLHASLITGCYPQRHGIYANTLFQPGRITPDWHWFRAFLKVPPLYDIARKAGLKTASLLWPGAARSGNRYVIPEVKTTRSGQSLPWLLLSSGSPLFMLRMGLRYRSLLKSLEFVHLDDFTTAVACRLLESRKTDLLLLHLLDLDGTRHRRGFQTPDALRVLNDQDRRLGSLLTAARQSGSFEDTTFFVFGDHAYLDVHTRVRINAAFRSAGLLEFNTRGRLTGWKAWANCCEGSAQVYLRDPADLNVHRVLAGVYAELQDGSRPAIENVYPRDRIQELKTADCIDYMLEAKAGCYFSPEVEGEVVAAGEKDVRAVHGYHPDRPGYSSLFFAAGAGVRAGVELAAMRIVDAGPTMAAVLGLRLPAAQGRLLSEILTGSSPWRA